MIENDSSRPVRPNSLNYDLGIESSEPANPSSNRSVLGEQMHAPSRSPWSNPQFVGVVEQATLWPGACSGANLLEPVGVLR